MDVFNKLYSQVSSSVSSTVSHLSGVLPGNPVTREFESYAHIASAGPGLLWKIYRGSKRSTKQEASIFVFEKRQLERWNKSDRDFILESLRRGVQQLTKIRHPQVLIVQHPLEESRESLAFATEPVFASLANIMGETINMPQPTNLSDYKLFDIEMKYGLLQIGEGLAFLHNDVKLLHKNLCPESIIINTSGVWKIFGLDFCVHNRAPANQAPDFEFQEFSPLLPSVCQSNLNYLAPECVLSLKHHTSSDMFSLGMLIYALYSVEKQCISPVKDIQQFKSRAQQLKHLNTNKLQCVPSDLREFVKMLLNINPEVRPDAHQFTKISFFEDVGIKTLTYLNSLLQWDNLQKSKFYKGLPEALSKLPQRVKLQRVLTCLTHDLGQPAMVPFILPSIFEIAQDCDQQTFCTYVLPHLKPLMKLSDPVQVMLLLLQRMELLLKLTPAEDIQLHVLPMLYRGLDNDAPQIHELCLSVLPTFAGLLDHSNLKNSLLPRIKRICLSTTTLSVRVNCLLCLGKLLDHLDKWLVLDDVLPFLPQIPSREPAVLMGILGILKIAMTHKKLGITKEILASRILPFLIPLCIENGLSLAQFNALVVLVKDMIQIVETEHRTKLEQLNTVKDEQKILASTAPIYTDKTKPVELDQAFAGLGLDTFISSNQINSKEKETVRDSNPIKPLKSPVTHKSQPENPSLSLINDWGGNHSSMGISNSHITNQKSPSPENRIYSPNANKNPMGNSFSTQSTQWNPPGNTVTSPLNFPSVGNPQTGFYKPPPVNASPFSNPWSSNDPLGPTKTTFQPSHNPLDSLLPMTAGNLKTPMNQMMQRQPLISSPTTDGKNKLSNEEILDLLS